MDYICTRETYLAVRQYQIDMFDERRYHSRANAHAKAVDEWYNKKSEYTDRVAWNAVCPKFDNVYTDELARHLNIFYGILRGRTYKQIEQKVREDNEYSEYYLYQLCDKYNVDKEAFKTRLEA